MSASSYVLLAPIELLPGEKADHYQGVPILTRAHCNHIFTICLECMDEWADQYNSHGGRATGQAHREVLDYFLTCEKRGMATELVVPGYNDEVAS